MLHQHLHTVKVGTSGLKVGERLSASAQSSAVYGFIYLAVGIVVFGLTGLLNDLLNGTVQLPLWLNGCEFLITTAIGYAIYWGKHYLQTGDWTPPMFPGEQPAVPQSPLPAASGGYTSSMTTDPAAQQSTAVAATGAVALNTRSVPLVPRAPVLGQPPQEEQHA